MTDQPYTPPRGALKDAPLSAPPQVEGETSSGPDRLAGGLALLGCLGALYCAAFHSCMCGHLAHDRGPLDVPLDLAVFALLSAAIGVLLLARSRLRGVAALLLLTLLPAEVRFLSVPLGLIALILTWISARRGKGPPLTLARRQRG
ncbi:MAG: hypothetical protein KDD82_17705 [Planctomycetes bacterium]|nr:hypothetical protein [Planctomycetota bacterium]